MRVMVTGATGFLGKNLVRMLRSMNYEVVGLGRRARALAELNDLGAETLSGEIFDTQQIVRASRDCEIIFHLAALSKAWGTRSDFYQANVLGTKSVLHACKENGIKRLVHVSSPSVVFQGRDLFDSDESEPYPSKFLCHYSESKKIAEDCVNTAIAQGLDAVILRPKAMIGPGDTSILPAIIEAARMHRLRQIGDGSNLLDLTYVDNVSFALIQSANSTSTSGKTYTITNGSSVNLWEVIGHVLKSLGLSDSLKTLSYKAAYELGRLFEITSLVTRKEPTLTRYKVAILGKNQTYNIEAARRDFSYVPIVSIEEGIEKTIAHFQSVLK